MTWAVKTYRRLAAWLWGVVSVVIGLSIGLYFEMEGKKMLFPVVLVVGVYLLYLTRSRSRKDGSLESGSVDWSAGFLSGEDDEAVRARMKRDGRLGGNSGDKDKSREWLDEFLNKQQQP